MAVFGYLFQTGEKNIQQSVIDQQKHIAAYGDRLKMSIGDFQVEKNSPVASSFLEREIGGRLAEITQYGDTVIVSKAMFILGSVTDSIRLIEYFRKKKVSVFCVDLDEDISLPRKRKLVVSEGGAALIFSILTALSVTENSIHGQKIKNVKRQQKRDGKYLGGPVPFGFKVSEEKELVKDPDAEPVILRIGMLRRERWSYRDIARLVGEEFGLKLSHEGVRKIHERNRQKK